MATPTVSVREWQLLVLPPDLDTPLIRERIVRAGMTSLGPAFRSAGRHLYANGLAGVVDAGRVQVQILPKIYDTSSTADDAVALLRLFTQSGLRIRAAANRARTGVLEGNILEPIVRYVAEALVAGLTDGVPRRYAVAEEVGTCLHGRLDLTKMARRSPGTDHLVAIRHTPLQYDHALTRTLRAFAAALGTSTSSARTKELLWRAERLLHQASRVSLTPSLVRQARPTRLEAEWDWIVSLAGLVADSRSSDAIAAGSTGGIGLLLPLDNLFEGMLRAVLRVALVDTPLRLAEGKFIGQLLRSDGGGAIDLKPDLVLHWRDSTRGAAFVGDAKWKRLTKNGRVALSPQDAYQVLAYRSRLGLPRATLFFPAASPIGAPRLTQYRVEPGEDVLNLVEVDVGALLSDDLEAQRQAHRALADCVVALCDASTP